MKLFHVSDGSSDWVVMARTQEEARSIIVANIPDLDLEVLEDPADRLDVIGFEDPIVSINAHITVR